MEQGCQLGQRFDCSGQAVQMLGLIEESPCKRVNTGKLTCHFAARCGREQPLGRQPIDDLDVDRFHLCFQWLLSGCLDAVRLVHQANNSSTSSRQQVGAPFMFGYRSAKSTTLALPKKSQSTIPDQSQCAAHRDRSRNPPQESLETPVPGDRLVFCLSAVRNWKLQTGCLR